MSGNFAYPRRCPLPASVRKWGEVAWNVFRSLISETLIFAVIFTASLSVIHLSSRICTMVFHSTMGNAEEVMFLATYVGTFTILFLSHLKAALVPKSLRSFEVLHPLLFGGMTVAFLIFVFPIGLFLQFRTFYFRHFTQAPVPVEGAALVTGEIIRIRRNGSSTGMGSAEPPDSPQLYSNDVLFLVSLVMIVYLSVRVLTAYRECHREKLQLEPGLLKINCHYVKYCFGLSIIEAMVAILLLIFTSGLGVFLQLAFTREWLTYFVLCLSGAILGQGLGIIEMEYFGMGPHIQMTEPLFSLMQWDARRAFLFMVGLPLLSLIYFDNDLYQDFGQKGILYHFILFSALMATNVALLVKYQTTFWYEVTQQARVRVLPGSRSGSGSSAECGRGGMRELQDRDGTTTATQEDQSGGGSISTGTCTSLLNLANNNTSLTTVDMEAQKRMARIEGSLEELMGSSSVVVQRLETTIQLEDEVELEVVKKNDNLSVLLKQCNENEPDHNANFDLMIEAQVSQEDLDKADLEFCMISEPEIPSPPSDPAPAAVGIPNDKDNHNHQGFVLEEEEVEELELELPSRPPSQPMIKLKRCPSNLPHCDLDTEAEGGK